MQAAAGTGKGLVPDSPQNLQKELVLMTFGLQPKETDFGLLTPRTVSENISVLARC